MVLGEADIHPAGMTATTAWVYEAAVGPHSELPAEPRFVANPYPPFHAGSGRRRGRCPARSLDAAGEHQHVAGSVRRRPAAGDSPGRKEAVARGGGHPPWPVRRSSQIVESRSIVNGASPGPAPAFQCHGQQLATHPSPVGVTLSSPCQNRLLGNPPTSIEAAAGTERRENRRAEAW